MTRSLVTGLGRGLTYFVLLEAMLVAAILFWPNFEENVGSLRAMAPVAVLRHLVDKLAEGGVAAYVLGQHFFKGCNTLGLAAAVLFAAGAVAGEVQRGTFELWISRPVPRARLLLERWVAGALAVSLPVFATSLTIPWLLGFVDEAMGLRPLMLASLHQSLFLLAIYAVTFLASCAGRAPLRIAFGVLGAATLQFSLYLVKGITDWSLFRLADLTVFVRITTSGRLDPALALPLLATILLSLGLSLAVFARRVP